MYIPKLYAFAGQIIEKESKIRELHKFTEAHSFSPGCLQAIRSIGKMNWNIT